METNSDVMEEDCAIRHCAYCLKVCGLPTILCDGCNKRAYCSRECQNADWVIHGNGQRHVNWCRRHECGEEDVDWEVVPIPNKGLGIRAKKLIPAGLKIIVEPVFISPTDHPGIQDLGPNGFPLEIKFEFNFFLAENIEGANAVALRISRVNHSCQPNASTIFDETARVAILFAQKDIQPGEEICIWYYSFVFFKMGVKLRFPGANPNWNMEEEFIFVKERLLHSIHKITCPAGCICNDPAFRALICEMKTIYATIIDSARQNKIEEALAAGEKLLDSQRRLNISWIYHGYTDVLLFGIAISRSETFSRAKRYLQSAAELFRLICPYSEKLTKKFERLLEHPEEDPNYMAIADKTVSDLAELFRTGFNL